MWSGCDQGEYFFIVIGYHVPCVAINHKIQWRYCSATCRNVHPYSTMIMGVKSKQTWLSYSCTLLSQHSLGKSFLIAKEIMMVICCAWCFCNALAVTAADKLRDRSAKTIIHFSCIIDQIGARRLFLPNTLNWNAYNEQLPMYHSMHGYFSCMLEREIPHDIGTAGECDEQNDPAICDWNSCLIPYSMSTSTLSPYQDRIYG